MTLAKVLEFTEKGEAFVLFRAGREVLRISRARWVALGSPPTMTLQIRAKK